MKLIALVHPKARLWVKGRQDLLEQIKASNWNNATKSVWFHCASVGEFEQARTLIELWKQHLPEWKIAITFFSPSGYTLRKNYDHADLVCYLPVDLPHHCKEFVSAINPTIVIFIKYEFWHNMLHCLHKNNIPVLSVSSIFRSDQLYFKGNAFHQKSLRFIHHFFVQNQKSSDLLSSIGISNHTISGDTRADRVIRIVESARENSLLDSFSSKNDTLMIGSAWIQDLNILKPWIDSSISKGIHIIIAPHEIDERTLLNIEALFPSKTDRYSNSTNNTFSNPILILNTMGMLSSAYRYATVAYVGGAFGKGLHNILEPAVYGIPIVFGNKFQKFQEAIDLVSSEGAFSISTSNEASETLNSLFYSVDKRKIAGAICKEYVYTSKGASEIVFNYCIHQLIQTA